MSVSFAISWTVISFLSMWACYRIGIREESERWKRRIDRRLHRRILLKELEEKRLQEDYELEGFEK
jgi:hypothetical protein